MAAGYSLLELLSDMSDVRVLTSKLTLRIKADNCISQNAELFL